MLEPIDGGYKLDKVPEEVLHTLKAYFSSNNQDIPQVFHSYLGMAFEIAGAQGLLQSGQLLALYKIYNLPDLPTFNLYDLKYQNLTGKLWELHLSKQLTKIKLIFAAQCPPIGLSIFPAISYFQEYFEEEVLVEFAAQNIKSAYELLAAYKLLEFAFTKSQYSLLIVNVKEIYQSVRVWRQIGAEITAIKLQTLLELKPDSEISDSEIPDSHDMDLKGQYYRFLIEKIGDGKWGDVAKKPVDLFSAGLPKPAISLDPEIELEILEKVFNTILSNKNEDMLAYYTRKDDKYALALLSPRKSPLSGTQKRHIELLQERYMEIVRSAKDDESVLAVAKISPLIRFNTSYYAWFAESETDYSKEIDTLVATHKSNVTFMGRESSL